MLYSFFALFSVSDGAAVGVVASAAARILRPPSPPRARVLLLLPDARVQILASYFLLLPLREDAGISLGAWRRSTCTWTAHAAIIISSSSISSSQPAASTAPAAWQRTRAPYSPGTSILPRLMACSLVVTLLVTPAATQFLNRPGASRERSLKTFFSAMAAVLLGARPLACVRACEHACMRACCLLACSLQRCSHGLSLRCTPPCFGATAAAAALFPDCFAAAVMQHSTFCTTCLQSSCWWGAWG